MQPPLVTLTPFDILSHGAPSDAQVANCTNSSGDFRAVQHYLDTTRLTAQQNQQQNQQQQQHAAWPPQHELLLLRLRAAGRSLIDIAKLFRRSPSTIETHLQRILVLGPECASLDHTPHSGDSWTEEEDSVLADLFLNKKQRAPAALAAVLRRSPWSIVNRLHTTHCLVNIPSHEEIRSEASIEWCRAKVAALKVVVVAPREIAGTRRRDREDNQDSYCCSFCKQEFATVTLIPCRHKFCIKCLPSRDEDGECNSCGELFDSLLHVGGFSHLPLKLVSRDEHLRMVAARQHKIQQEEEEEQRARAAAEAAAEQAQVQQQQQHPFDNDDDDQGPFALFDALFDPQPQQRDQPQQQRNRHQQRRPAPKPTPKNGVAKPITNKKERYAEGVFCHRKGHSAEIQATPCTYSKAPHDDLRYPGRMQFVCVAGCVVGYGPPINQTTIARSDRNRRLHCECETPAKIKTSGTPANPGRRYFCCPQRRCKFFAWASRPVW